MQLNLRNNISSRAAAFGMAHHSERRLASAAIACVYDEHVLVIKSRYKKYWSFPGGLIDKNETPVEAALRELHEEAGISVSRDLAQFRMVVDRAGEEYHTYQFVFEARLYPETFDGSIKLDKTEIEAWEFVSRRQIIDSDRRYSQSVHAWAVDDFGYHEQVFHTHEEADDED